MEGMTIGVICLGTLKYKVDSIQPIIYKNS